MTDLHLDPETPGDARTERYVRLVSRHEKRVFAYIMSLVMDWATAQDIYQETSMRLWRQFDQYEDGTDFGAWACTVAYYQVLTYREKAGRDKLRFSPAFLASIAESAAKDESGQGGRYEMRLRLLAECRGKLSPAADQLLQLVYGEGMQIRQAATKMGRSPGMLYKTLSRIRSSLHQCIERRMKMEGLK